MTFPFGLVLLSPLLILFCQNFGINSPLTDSFLSTGLWSKFTLQKVPYKTLCDLSPACLFVHSQSTLPSTSRISILCLFHDNFLKYPFLSYGGPKDILAPHPQLWLQYLFWQIFICSLPSFLASDPFCKFYTLTVLPIWCPVYSITTASLLRGAFYRP